jgi:hypothetical protein
MYIEYTSSDEQQQLLSATPHNGLPVVSTFLKEKIGGAVEAAVCMSLQCEWVCSQRGMPGMFGQPLCRSTESKVPDGGSSLWPTRGAAIGWQVLGSGSRVHGDFGTAEVAW